MKPFEPANPLPFSNPLIHSTSPYLLQHARNPVFWYPWGEQAFARARADNKPIFLSIGYSTCYWCHVMEREVFENPSIAALMNNYFVNIKVDREELPEIDEIYMAARQLMTREGGWPNNVFLTPELKPFFAGGTFLPEDTGQRPGFPRVLEALHAAWKNQRTDILTQADQLTNAIRSILTPAHEGEKQESISVLATRLFGQLKDVHDARAGGFFHAPKFPNETYLLFLLNYYETYGETAAIDIVTKTLYKMAAGGINDHVGCGFHRYAVDKEWYVPHFEKMLYNQALIARCYTEHYRLTRDPYSRDMARSILDFAQGPLKHPGGAFFCGLDAENNEVEGAYYVWDERELRELLSDEDMLFFNEFYALAEVPHYPGHPAPLGKAIVARKPLPEAAHERDLSYVEVMALSGQIFNKLLERRNKRLPPRLDDKILTGWNGLMIEAYATASVHLSHPAYLDVAVRAADAVWSHNYTAAAGLKRAFAKDISHLPATLEDYAYFIRGLTAVYAANKDAATLERINRLLSEADQMLADAQGGYYLTRQDTSHIIRLRHAGDSALPAPIAVMLRALDELSALTDDPRYERRAARLAGTLPALVHTQALPEFATALAALLGRTTRTQEPLASSPAESPVTLSASLFPKPARAGAHAEIVVTLDIAPGLHINDTTPTLSSRLPTQLNARGEGIEEIIKIQWPDPRKRHYPLSPEPLAVYEGRVTVSMQVKLSKNEEKLNDIRIFLRTQPCTDNACQKPVDMTVSVV